MVGRLQRILDNDADYVTPQDMLAELRDNSKQLAANLREAHGLCDEHGDIASASLLEKWIDEVERRNLGPLRGNSALSQRRGFGPQGKLSRHGVAAMAL
jgi:hypothetical protein